MITPKGWKLVPIKAAGDQLRAGNKVTTNWAEAAETQAFSYDELAAIYSEMVAAAPEPACTDCGGRLDEPSYYNPEEKELLCNDCAGKLEDQLRLVLRNLFMAEVARSSARMAVELLDQQDRMVKACSFAVLALARAHAHADKEHGKVYAEAYHAVAAALRGEYE